jgi:hypothetical protein
VTQDRFVAEINDPAHQSPLRDLVVGVFTLLEHTPIIAMGLNRSMHWRMPSEDDWHALGHLLAPKKIWSDLIEQPGMKSLTMEGKSKRIASTVVRLKIEPSVKVRPGVFVESNAHYDFPEEKKFSSPVAILSADWDQSQIFAKESAERLLAQE